MKTLEVVQRKGLLENSSGCNFGNGFKRTDKIEHRVCIETIVLNDDGVEILTVCRVISADQC